MSRRRYGRQGAAVRSHRSSRRGPVHVGVADGPGNFIDGYDEFVLVHAEPVEQPDGTKTVPQQVRFTLFAGAAAGAYYLEVD